MSYILEALKKSERERRQVETPATAIAQPMQVVTPANTPWLQPVAGGVGAGLLLALLWWAFSGANKLGDAGTTEKKLSGIAATTGKLNKMPPVVSMPTELAPLAENTKPLIDYRSADVFSQPVTPVAKASASRGLPQPASSAAAPTKSPARPPIDVVSKPKPLPSVVAVKQKTASDQVKTTPTAPPLVALQTAEAQPKAQSDQDKKTDDDTQSNGVVPANTDPARIYNMQELPVAVRRAVPKMAIPGYIMSSDASSRTVTINDRNLKEGDELIAGLRVDMIAQDYLLMSYKGYRFRAEMF
jgi:general secretion pathway protein B